MKTIVFFITWTLMCCNTFAVPTTVIVRAKAKDAKFIGNSIGGAYVVIRNSITDEILAQGSTEGSTGNTDLIMNTPKERTARISDGRTSKFSAEIDIEEPVFVKIEVFAPFHQKQATVTSTTELWLIPGKDIVGDGIIVEIPGFIVDVLQPRTHQFIALQSLERQKMTVQANIVMMCGCTVSKGGIWDSEDIEAKGIVKRNGKNVEEIDLALRSPNLFEGVLTVEDPGDYEVVVYAYNSASGNTGVDKIHFVVTE